jgi:hypothetical protein
MPAIAALGYLRLAYLGFKKLEAGPQAAYLKGLHAHLSINHFALACDKLPGLEQLVLQLELLLHKLVNLGECVDVNQPSSTWWVVQSRLDIASPASRV